MKKRWEVAGLRQTLRVESHHRHTSRRMTCRCRGVGASAGTSPLRASCVEVPTTQQAVAPRRRTRRRCAAAVAAARSPQRPQRDARRASLRRRLYPRLVPRRHLQRQRAQDADSRPAGHTQQTSHVRTHTHRPTPPPLTSVRTNPEKCLNEASVGTTLRWCVQCGDVSADSAAAAATQSCAGSSAMSLPGPPHPSHNALQKNFHAQPSESPSVEDGCT